MIEVCDRVLYGFRNQKKSQWRVTGHMKRMEVSFRNPHPKDSFQAEMWATVIGVVKREIAKERKKRKEAGLPCKRRYRLIWCKPEEATHLSLYAVCGAIAPIEKCKKVGTVEWDEKTIAEERKSALLHIQMNDQTPGVYQWE